MYGGLDIAEAIRTGTLNLLKDSRHAPHIAQRGIKLNRPPHSPTPVRVPTVSGAAGAKAISLQSYPHQPRSGARAWAKSKFLAFLMSIHFKKIQTTTFLLLLFCSPLLASSLRFHPAFSDDMVLQRDKPLAIFGFGKPGAEVSVTFKNASQKTKVGPEGLWKAMLPVFPASTGEAILTATSVNESVTCKRVLVGDVWFCSGQSNMARVFRMFSQISPMVASDEKPLFRIYTVTEGSSPAPLSEPVPPQKRDVKCNSWHPAKAEFLSEFSVIAYFFGAKVSEALKIPIGVMVSAHGGSQIETWISKEAFDANALTVGQKHKLEADETPADHSAYYNATVHPYLNLTLKGFLWYQGESNSMWPDAYRKQFPALIRSWREEFHAPDAPFYFVQLAPMGARGWDKSGEAWAWFRSAQMSALELPKTGMTVITDLGEYEDIHPQAKKEAAERLALFALRDAGLPVQPESPLFDSMENKGKRCVIHFKNAGSGLETRRVVMNKKKGQPIQKDPDAFVVEADQIRGFALCGEDKKFIDAQAAIVGDHVEVWSDSVPHPVAVRYAWTAFPLCNLFSKDGLPVAPFRTDSFPMPKLVSNNGK